MPAGTGNALNLQFQGAVPLALVTEDDSGHDFGVMANPAIVSFTGVTK